MRSAMLLAVSDLSPEGIERIRRSLAMVAPGNPASLPRDEVLWLLRELQRLQATIGAAVGQVRAALADLEGSG